jgi:hypothetical protein
MVPPVHAADDIEPPMALGMQTAVLLRGGNGGVSMCSGRRRAAKLDDVGQLVFIQLLQVAAGNFAILDPRSEFLQALNAPVTLDPAGLSGATDIHLFQVLQLRQVTDPLVTARDVRVDRLERIEPSEVAGGNGLLFERLIYERSAWTKVGLPWQLAAGYPTLLQPILNVGFGSGPLRGYFLEPDCLHRFGAR